MTLPHFPWSMRSQLWFNGNIPDYIQSKTLVYQIKIKAVFSEENYVPQSQVIRMLFIVSQLYRLKFINYFKGEHAQTQFWSNFEITKCCGYRGYKVKVIKSNILTPNNVSMQIWRERSGSVEECLTRDWGFEPHRRHCVVVLEQDTFILV